MKNSLVLVLILFLGSCSFFESSKLINGSPAPEISLPDRDGNTVSLSSLRGKLVFVQFWASWCKPCREENPKLVKMFRTYTDTTFKKADKLEILSISLDGDKEKWLEAIGHDALFWKHHVNSFQEWKTPAVDSYQVSSIPSSFLVDQNGIIIGKNLKPRDLEKLLANLARQ